MSRFYEPDLGSEPDSPFARDAQNKLVRRSYWLDMNDRSLVIVMTNGIGAHLTNDEKRAHLTDLKRDHLIDRVCIQEILQPEEDVRNVVLMPSHFCNWNLKFHCVVTIDEGIFKPRIGLSLRTSGTLPSIRSSFNVAAAI